MTLAGLATPFVVPPANLAALAGLALLAGRRRLAGIALALLLLLALPVVADGLVAALEAGQQAVDPDVADAQAIVILGAEIERDGTAGDGTGRTVPGLLSLRRLRTGAALARRTRLPILVSGGLVREGAAPVAVAMARSLREDFFAPARWVEDRSVDTFGNARDSAAMLAPAGIGAVLLVTDQWHMRRALLAFRAAGLRAVPAPVPPDDVGGVTASDFVPSARAWQRSYWALHEWIGLGWYLLRARL